MDPLEAHRRAGAAAIRALQGDDAEALAADVWRAVLQEFPGQGQIPGAMPSADAVGIVEDSELRAALIEAAERVYEILNVEPIPKAVRDTAWASILEQIEEAPPPPGGVAD